MAAKWNPVFRYNISTIFYLKGKIQPITGYAGTEGE
jgi:hypothetical protein